MKVSKYARASISFFTIIPAGNAEFIPEAIYFLWLPYLLSGFVSFIVLYEIESFVSKFILAIIALGIIGIIHGAQNLDALFDLGDGLMKRGETEKRLKVMKDPAVGAGGLFMFFVVYGISVSALFSVPTNKIPYMILFSQLVDIIFMSVVFFRNKPIGEGYGKFFSVISSRWTFLITSFGIPFILSLLLFPEYIVVLFSVIIIAIILRLYLYKIFGGVNGDIVGASGEIGRMFALLLSTISIFLV